MRKTRNALLLLVPVGVVLFFFLLDIGGISARGAGPLYDVLLRLRAPAAPPTDVLLLDVDEQATASAGPWPWQRSLLADALVLLKEMGARSVLLDLPLAERSTPTVDPAALHEALPEALSREFTLVEENIQSLFDAIRRGSVRPQDSARYVADLVALVDMAKVRLANTATGIERDDDALLGQAAGFFARTWVRVDLAKEPGPPVDPAIESEVLRKVSLDVASTGGDPSYRAAALRFPVLPLVRGSQGGGFSGVPDGDDPMRRGVFLLGARGDTHIGQMAFSALLDMIGNPEIGAGKRTIVLKNATLPGRQPADVTIPLTDEGRMLLPWPRAAAGDGFRHLSIDVLLQHATFEATLITTLRGMDNHGYLSYLRSDSALLDVHEGAARLQRTMIVSGNEDSLEEWKSMRGRFFSLCDQLLNGDAEARITADANRMIQSPALSEEEKQKIRQDIVAVPTMFEDARKSFAQLSRARAVLQGSLPGALVIVSLGASLATPPVGMTPFGGVATDAMVSAALAGSILGGRYLREVPPRLADAFSLFVSLLLALVASRLKPLAALLSGLGAAVVILVAACLLFIIDGTFASPVSPGGSLAFTGAAVAVLTLARSRRDAASLRAGLSGRLSREGLKRVMAAPRLVAPAAEGRDITVLSAGLRGLAAGPASAGFTETAKLLRAYNLAAGEAILTQDGMLGPSEGDALTAYFGASGDGDGHVSRACRAALRLLAVEGNLKGGTRLSVGARMGLDTGTCVVGDLGARGAMPWSVAGAPTDLAARLQALTQRYGVSILVTAAVRDAVTGGFHLRALETLRIAGTGASVRVFELAGEEGGMEAWRVEALAVFDEGRARFEEREWQRALALFTRVLSMRAADGPAAVFADRCRHALRDPGSASSAFPC